jgi:hypothetical protein
MTTGKIEAEVGLFEDVNAWETIRSWFTESELLYWGWDKTKIPVLPLDPDQLWEYDLATARYYRDRHRDLPLEVAAVVNQAAAATAAKGSSSSSSR